MDIRQASDYLGISGDTLYRYALGGIHPGLQAGQSLALQAQPARRLDGPHEFCQGPIGLLRHAPRKEARRPRKIRQLQVVSYRLSAVFPTFN